MDVFSKRHGLPKPIQEEIENLSSCMFTKEIKFPDGFTGNSSKCLRNNVNSVLYENTRGNSY